MIDLYVFPHPLPPTRSLPLLVVTSQPCRLRPHGHHAVDALGPAWGSGFTPAGMYKSEQEGLWDLEAKVT